MAKGKKTVYALISEETGAQCGYVQVGGTNYDKAKQYRRYDKTAQKHVMCKTKAVKKGGTKALANSK